MSNDELIQILQSRFFAHPHRHPDLKWEKVQQHLESQLNALEVLKKMEASGGQPDVILFPDTLDKIIFVDCAPETPKNRVSLCYDRAAWEARKDNKPASSALEMAEEIGIILLTESEYFTLQSYGPVDQKTSSWLLTPADIRAKGGAIFGDHRFGRTFFYHNGVQSYYAVRGFRGKLILEV